MSYRPGSNAGRPGSRGGPGGGPGGHMGTAAGRPPGTASRLMTGMAGQRGQAATGGGVALSAQVNVTERPVTQQGLGGMKTGASRGPHRQVQDVTYFQGLLRAKVNELQQEIRNLQVETTSIAEDQSTFVTYEKSAEESAANLKQLQAEMGDYNTLVDKLTTDENIGDIQMDYEDLKAQNDKITNSLDGLFEEKQQKAHTIKTLDLELQTEKSMTDTLISDMNSQMRQKYLELKDLNEHLLTQLESGQQELDLLNMKKQQLEEELSHSPVKQEAVRQYGDLNDKVSSRDGLLHDMKAQGSPQVVRENLLKQVKVDNQEIASMDKQLHEIKEKMGVMGDNLTQLNMDIEENQGERNQKYKELKKREETMNDFIDTFAESRGEEVERIAQLEQNAVLMLEHMSRTLARAGHLPSSQELTSMKDDLDFKEDEMTKSKYTASGLAGESEKLHQDLGKVEQLESKINTELDMLRERIDQMTTQVEIFEDMDRLKDEGERKKQKLGVDKVTLERQRENSKRQLSRMSAEYDALKAQLSDNETYSQLGNMERKWQHHEQNNFVMQDFISSKEMECDYRQISRRMKGMITQYNTALQSRTSQPTY